MTHEKEFKRPDGSRVAIEVRFWTESFRKEYQYDINVYVCAPKKRKFLGVYDSNEYQYRRLDQQERKDYILSKQLEYVKPEEILEAKLELWEKLKPTL